MNYSQKLEDDGFFVIERAISETFSAELLGFVIDSFSDTNPDFILESSFRVHSPLELTPLVERAVNEIVTPAYSALDPFLQGSKRLVELSSITVFPHANAQNIHFDEQNAGKYLISIFVNLAPTSRESGALSIIPGSHKAPDHDFSEDPYDVVELPIGSAVFMNSKTWHGGGSNQTLDRIRPVFYMSFGEPGMDGPTYSIRDDVFGLGKQLSDFNGSTIAVSDWGAEARPRVPENKLIVAPLNIEQDPGYLLLKNGVVEKRFDVSDDSHAAQQLFTMVMQQPGHRTLGEIHKELELDMGWLQSFFQYYGNEGWFTA